MTDQTISELLVLFLLAVTCLRIFFQKHVKTDALAAVPIIALLISILNFFTFGASFFSFVILFLSFFVFIWNVRALLRLKENLVIDHYGPWFVTVSLFNLVLIIAVCASVVIFRPLNVYSKKSGVSKTVTRYTGSFSKGFKPVDKFFQGSNAKIIKYKKTQKAIYVKNSFGSNTQQMPKANENLDSKGTILFIPDITATSETYSPVLIKLAQDGYTVYSAEFYSKDMPWFGNILDSMYARSYFFRVKKLLHHEEYLKDISGTENKFVKQYEAFVKIINPAEKDAVAIVGEDIAEKSFPVVLKESILVDFSFNLGKVQGYTTAGYGPVEQTNPLVAKMLGYNRDTSLFMSVHLATAIENAFSDYFITFTGENK